MGMALRNKKAKNKQKINNNSPLQLFFLIIYVIITDHLKKSKLGLQTA